MNRKSLSLYLANASTKECLEYSLDSLARRQSRLSCTPSEYKEIQDEIDELKRMAREIQPNHRIERIDLRKNSHC